MAGGRPRKYANAQEAAAAKLSSNRATYHQRKIKEEEGSTPDIEFAIYEPALRGTPVSSKGSTNGPIPTTDTTIAAAHRRRSPRLLQAPLALALAPAPALAQSIKGSAKGEEEREGAALAEAVGSLHLRDGAVSKEEQEVASIL